MSVSPSVWDCNGLELYSSYKIRRIQMGLDCQGLVPIKWTHRVRVESQLRNRLIS